MVSIPCVTAFDTIWCFDKEIQAIPDNSTLTNKLDEMIDLLKDIRGEVAGSNEDGSPVYQ